MDSFEIVFRPSVHKDLKRLPKAVVVQVMSRIEDLSTDPLPSQMVKLSSAEGVMMGNSMKNRLQRNRVVLLIQNLGGSNYFAESLLVADHFLHQRSKGAE